MAKGRGKLAGGKGWSVTSEPSRGENRPVSDGRRRAKIRLETRRGRPFTRCDLEGTRPEEATQLVRKFKAALGTGGGARAGGLDLQGDHRSWLREALTCEGFEVRG